MYWGESVRSFWSGKLEQRAEEHQLRPQGIHKENTEHCVLSSMPACCIFAALSLPGCCNVSSSSTRFIDHTICTLSTYTVHTSTHSLLYSSFSVHHINPSGYRSKVTSLQQIVDVFIFSGWCRFCIHNNTPLQNTKSISFQRDGE